MAVFLIPQKRATCIANLYYQLELIDESVMLTL